MIPIAYIKLDAIDPCLLGGAFQTRSFSWVLQMVNFESVFVFALLFTLNVREHHDGIRACSFQPLLYRLNLFLALDITLTWLNQICYYTHYLWMNLTYLNNYCSSNHAPLYYHNVVWHVVGGEWFVLHHNCWCDKQVNSCIWISDNVISQTSSAINKGVDWLHANFIHWMMELRAIIQNIGIII